MSIKIQSKIVGYEVVKEEEEAALKEKAAEEKRERTSAKIIRMTESILRPEGMESLEGSTYKIKTPLDDHAMYVTINDIILNLGTEHEQRRPFEIFINSKNMDHFQWIVALTRLMSAVFRKGGDVTFLAEELQAVFDPRGGVDDHQDSPGSPERMALRSPPQPAPSIASASSCAIGLTAALRRANSIADRGVGRW